MRKALQYSETPSRNVYQQPKASRSTRVHRILCTAALHPRLRLICHGQLFAGLSGKAAKRPERIGTIILPLVLNAGCICAAEAEVVL